jgi:hypothetical protein
MRVKLGGTDPVPAWSAIAAVLPHALAATFFDVKHHVYLCVQVEKNQFENVM